jgi:hypothetical protein
MIRRSFLRKLAAVPLFAAAAAVPAATTNSTKLKILMKSAWGSDDPTKAAFPFLHGDVLSEAGHDVQIFLLGEAVSLMRKSVANAVVPVGWPPPGRSPRQTRRQKDTDLRVRRLLTRAGGDGNRSGRVRRKIRQS